MKRFFILLIFLMVGALLISWIPCRADDDWVRICTYKTYRMTTDLPYIYIVMQDDSIYRSTDNGANWEQRTNDATGHHCYPKAISMDFANPDIVFAGFFVDSGLRLGPNTGPRSPNSSRVYRSIDAGSTWTRVDWPYCDSVSTDISSLLNHPEDSNLVFQGRFIDDVLYTSHCTVRRSLYRGDAGTWGTIADESETGDVLCLASDPDDKDILYAGCEAAGVYKAINASAGNPDWDTTGLKDKTVNSIVVDPTNTSILYAGTTDDVYRSADAGTTWTRIAQDSDFTFNSLALNPEDPNILYALRDDDQVYFYYYGRTDHWIDMSVGLPGADINQLISDVNSPDSIAVYAATDSGVYLYEEEDKEFIRGDAKGDDGDADMVDYVYLYNYLLSSGPAPPCMDAADVNDNGTVNLDDLTYLFRFIFVSGPAPPRPYGPFPDSCGTDPTSDSWGCIYSPCYGQ